MNVNDDSFLVVKVQNGHSSKFFFKFSLSVSFLFQWLIPVSIPNPNNEKSLAEKFSFLSYSSRSYFKESVSVCI